MVSSKEGGLIKLKIEKKKNITMLVKFIKLIINYLKNVVLMYGIKFLIKIKYGFKLYNHYIILLKARSDFINSFYLFIQLK